MTRTIRTIPNIPTKRTIRRSSAWPREAGIAFFILLLGVVSGLAACKSKPVEQGKRYHLTGKVLSVAAAQGSATIDSDAIPGFMGAMAMPYPIPDQKALASLGPGDRISADIVVASDGSYRLENIVITQKGSASSSPPSSANPHEPQPGEKVPDFALIDQDGRRIHLAAFKGDVVLLTFIYTRCPFPDYCPLVSKNFADIYAASQAVPSLRSKVRLLTVSFDPTHDTPEVLRKYAATFRPITGRRPFDRWEFATAPPKELEKITNFFGVVYDSSQKQIVHSLSTSVISPQGTIYKWYDANDWRPSDLLVDATKILTEENQPGGAGRASLPREKAAVSTGGS
ncbi:MAG: SCO family protein [Candidatus Acidiferrales bacterium]